MTDYKILGSQLIDEVERHMFHSDETVDEMWQRVERDVPDLWALMRCALDPDTEVGQWWQDKPHQVLYRIVQLAALRAKQ